jgi:hypothetical protein
MKADLLVDHNGTKYVVELKRSAEGRRDRLIPLLSQAVLQIQEVARQFPESIVPVAVVAAPRIPQSVAKQVLQFAMRHAPGVAVGLIDSEGFRAFQGHGLEALDAERSGSSRGELAAHGQSSYLFSNLNQWMLKILLSSKIPESLLSAPRGRYRNASQLAQSAGVSVMSAFRFLRQLSKEGFLDKDEGWLRIVRIEELMQRWRSANQRSAIELPVRWILRGNEDQLYVALRSYVSQMGARASQSRRSRDGRVLKSAPRVCLGLFAAADLLGFRFVNGIPPHIYLERSEMEVLKDFGLSVKDAEGRPDAYVRIPESEEAVFRASVMRDGLPVCDIVQVWLDVSNYPARGEEQAEQIWRRVLAPLVSEERK